MNTQELLSSIQEASKVVGTTWPLYSFVTSNPLSGYESLDFRKACQKAYLKTGTLAYPESSFFKTALEKQHITEEKFYKLFKTYNFNGTLEEFFIKLDELKKQKKVKSNTPVDQVLVKWLSVFMDEGLASWPMPNKEKGFYASWLSLAKYDQDLNLDSFKQLPKSSLEAIVELTSDLSKEQQTQLFENCFLALPGWVGYIKYRKEQNSTWQDEFPIHLEDYIAVRLLITKGLGLNLNSDFGKIEDALDFIKLIHSILNHIEKTWQFDLISKLELDTITLNVKQNPDAQLVFCIDTRSELIRRHVEGQGNYETFGYAGFFGIAMDYEHPFSGLVKKACPPILGSAYKVTEEPIQHKSEAKADLQRRFKQNRFKNYFLNRMKNILPSAFGFVEGAGLAYAYQLLHRTFNWNTKSTTQVETNSKLESTCQTHLQARNHTDAISIEEQAEIVKSAFLLTGWRDFASLVVFAGHGAHTANNPFGSSLDCGACAASPGRHNARMLARLANSKEVQSILKSKHGYSIPEDTWFIGAEHNTTTDEIFLFDAEVPERFQERVEQLKSDLKKAQVSSTAERLGKKNSVSVAYKKSTDWSETRPEWGLAKNAGFVIGPRALTQNINLQGGCFLHSYHWKYDDNGEALNAILNGPMVVTQWINNHYYFSTVDNNVYGSGSKITHNVVGKFGVVQGNGGDLKSGLPLQSVNLTDTTNYHQPQRLSVFVHAPKDRLDQLLELNPHLKQLIENNWIHLLIIDPHSENQVFKYVKNLVWERVSNPSLVNSQVVA